MSLGESLDQLLVELAKHHESTLALLDEKLLRLRNLDGPGLKALQPKEEASAAALERYVRSRQQLLAEAADAGIQAASLRELVGHLPGQEQQRTARVLERALALGRSVQQRCVTNWVLGQRAWLHTNQLLQILGGGESDATYGQTGSTRGGTLIDQAV
jgi:hypothetical protein